MKITKEDFNAWREQPVTQAFFQAIDDISTKAWRDCADAMWGDAIWRTGKAEVFRAAAVARANLAEDILTITFGDEEDAEQQRDITN